MPSCSVDVCSPYYRYLTPADLDAVACSAVPIPENEAERLFSLRETRLLDSDTSDPMFDRFVYLAKRIFNVPMAAVGLIDVNRMFIKAEAGLNGVTACPRDVAFCAYTILPHTSDVLVVEDATKDERFMNNVMVTGPTHLRFYAGAALIVDNVKIGTICVFDTLVRYDFSYKDRMNLLDLGQAVSTLIKERKCATLSYDKICAAMMTDMMHNVRTPLTAIDLATSMISEYPKVQKSKVDEWMVRTIVEKMCKDSEDPEGNKAAIDLKVAEMVQFCNASTNESPPDMIVIDNPVVVKDLQSAVGQLKVVVESSICLGQFIVQKAEKNSTLGASFTSCNVLKSINITRRTLVHMEYSSNIEWTVDSSRLDLGSEHICTPKAINFILLNTVEQLMSRWKCISFDISFMDTENGIEYESVLRVLEDIPMNPEGLWEHGLLIIEISLSGEIDVAQRSNPFMPENHLGFYSRDQVLKDCEGSSVHSINEASKSETLRYQLPCAIFVDTIPKDMGHLFVQTDFNMTPHDLDSCSVSSDPDEESTALASSLLSKLSDTKRLPFPTSKILSTRTAMPPLESPLYFSCPGSPRIRKDVKVAIPSFVSEPSTPREKILRVLLVEDSVSIQKLMSRWLKSRGCAVTVAENGKVGLHYMQTVEYDVCFIDFLMVSWNPATPIPPLLLFLCDSSWSIFPVIQPARLLVSHIYVLFPFCSR